jgi:uncharacterized lipoprotein YehR (DUF1307 family)
MKNNVILAVVLLVVSVSLLGCGGKKDSRTLDDFIKAYTDQDVAVDKEEKPIFSMIGAADGVIFKMDDNVVKIYEYASVKELEKAEKDFEIIKDWPTNGRFLLETNSDEATKIFTDMK